ncbi:MAG TPA: divalent metal cation transporter [Methylocella sp.]
MGNRSCNFRNDDQPLLFFWQASQEAEDTQEEPQRKPLTKAPRQGQDAIARIRSDTYFGMAFSNLVALAIIVTTAATLHVGGITNIETSSQAAEALKPIAGEFAFAVFALGILGTGLLAVPVLAGSAAYAVGEAFRWPIGLARQPRAAKAFYATIVFATMLGIGMNFLALSPIKALFWSAVLNGIVALPVMAIMMIMTANPTIMGKFPVTGVLKLLGWTATVVIAASVAGMGITASMG